VWKSEFASTIFRITPVKSWRLLQAGAPRSYPAGSPLSPALLILCGTESVKCMNISLRLCEMQCCNATSCLGASVSAGNFLTGWTAVTFYGRTVLSEASFITDM